MLLQNKEKTEEPHMHAIMNNAKIRPYGGGKVLDSKAGVQLKTKQNIEPSKAETTIPIDAIRQSVNSAVTAWLRPDWLDDALLSDAPQFSFQVAAKGIRQIKRKRIAKSNGMLYPPTWNANPECTSFMGNTSTRNCAKIPEKIAVTYIPKNIIVNMYLSNWPEKPRAKCSETIQLSKHENRIDVAIPPVTRPTMRIS